MKSFKKIMAGALSLAMIGSFSAMADNEAFSKNWLTKSGDQAWDAEFNQNEDGSVNVVGSTWFGQRLYNKEYDGDVTIEMSFTWPEDRNTPWVGLIAHAKPVDQQPQAIDTFEGTYMRITGFEGSTEAPAVFLQGTLDGAAYGDKVACDAPKAGSTTVITLKCEGTNATAIVDGKEVMKLEGTAAASGKYVGIYASQADGVKINYVKVNGEVIQGKADSTPESKPESKPESTPESKPESKPSTPATGVGYPLAAVAVLGVSAMGLLVARKSKKK